jgi:hypothetical protein
MPELDERLQHMSGLIDQGIALKRRIIEDLRPSALANLGLMPALEIFLREFAQRSGLQLAWSWRGAHRRRRPAGALPPGAGGADQCAAPRRRDPGAGGAERGEGGLQLSVRDNGRGFDPGGVPPGHHGLLGMRYRIESLGGQLELLGARRRHAGAGPPARAAGRSARPDGRARCLTASRPTRLPRPPRQPGAARTVY